MRINLTIMLCFTAILCFAQQLPTVPKVIPSSPNVEAFKKYGDIPVSLHTGVPEVAIPLYEIRAGDITVPINLSYHSSGIKVMEEASRVGLGWVLNAGGVVSRTIADRDDFAGGGSYYYHSPSVQDLPFIPSGDLGRSFNVQNGCEVDFSNGSFNFDTYDTQPDQYNFNFLGRNGKFAMKRSKEVVLNKVEKLEIKVEGSAADSITIKTSDGFVYDFNVVETASELSDGVPHNVSWYLSKITSPSGEVVTFVYQTSSNYIKTLGAWTETRSIASLAYNTSGNTAHCSPMPDQFGSVPGKLYSNVILTEIKFNGGKVKFVYSDREDIENDIKIDQIEVSSKQPGGDEYSVVKKFELDYEYFVGDADQDFSTGKPQNFVTKRLKLKRVKEKNLGDETGQLYEFSYYNEFDPAGTLPAKTSFARDHWGYYNGKLANTSLIPEVHPVPSTNIVRSYLGVMGSNRNTNPLYVNLFALKDIIYPTTGQTNFEYEAHEYDFSASIVRDNSYFGSFPEVTEHKHAYIYNGTDYGDNPASNNLASKVIDATDLYIDQFGSTGVLNVNCFFRFNTTYPNCAIGAHNITFKLVREDGFIVSGPTNITEILGTELATCSNGSGILFANSYNVVPGKYYWILNIAQGDGLVATVSFNSMHVGVVSDRGPLPAGGLRVKRISTIDKVGALPNIKKYQYDYMLDKNNDGQPERYSYGVRMSRPQYMYFDRSDHEECSVIGTVTICSNVECQSVRKSSDSVIPLFNSGTAVSYNQVITYYGENGENGKSISIFHNTPDLIIDYSADEYVYNGIVRVPKRPPLATSITDPFNGLIKEKIDFVYNNGVFDTLKHVLNTYIDRQLSSENLFVGIEKRKIGTGSDEDKCLYYQNFIFPVIQVNRINIQTTVDKNFDTKAGTVQTLTTTYQFDNPLHYQMTAKIEDLGIKLRTTTFKYSADFEDVNCDIATLAMKGNKFIHSVPLVVTVEEKTEGVTKCVSQEIVQYGLFEGNKFLLPKSFLKAELDYKSTSPPFYVPNVVIDPTKYKVTALLDYGGNGKIRTVSDLNGYSMTYLWGYDNALPIAKVENALATNVYYTGFEDDVTDISFDAHTGRKSKMSNFSVLLTGLTPGTYVLSYWIKNTGWSLITQDVTVGSSYEISLNGQVDDVRFYSKGAQMTTFSYDPLIGITSVSDVNNIPRYYEYDSLNRLWLIRDTDGNIIKHYTYNYRLKF